MQQQRGQVRSYSSFIRVVGVVLLASACSAPMPIENSSSTLRLTAKTSLVEAVGPQQAGPLLFVDVTAKNESLMPISYTGGCVDNVTFALYLDAARSGIPFVEVPSNDPVCMALTLGSLAPSDSQTFEGSSWASQLKQGTNSITAGTYYVTATLNYVGNTTMTVDAGTVTIP